MRIVILQTGDPVDSVEKRRGPFSDWICDGIGDAWGGTYLVHDARKAPPPPALLDAAAYVITGSSSSVTERSPWMLDCEAFLRGAIASGAPVLGICFGHQMVAQALGGQVHKNPEGREIGTVHVERMQKDAIFERGDRFWANSSHVDCVVTPPTEATVLARTSRDAVAAFGVGKNVRCVQFHPEFDADVMRGYIDARAEVIRGEGADPSVLREAVQETPHARAVLRNFVRAFVMRGTWSAPQLPSR